MQAPSTCVPESGLLHKGHVPPEILPRYGLLNRLASLAFQKVPYLSLIALRTVVVLTYLLLCVNCSQNMCEVLGSRRGATSRHSLT